MQKKPKKSTELINKISNPSYMNGAMTEFISHPNIMKGHRLSFNKYIEIISYFSNKPREFTLQQLADKFNVNYKTIWLLKKKYFQAINKEWRYSKSSYNTDRKEKASIRNKNKISTNALSRKGSFNEFHSIGLEYDEQNNRGEKVFRIDFDEGDSFVNSVNKRLNPISKKSKNLLDLIINHDMSYDEASTACGLTSKEYVSMKNKMAEILDYNGQSQGGNLKLS